MKSNKKNKKDKFKKAVRECIDEALSHADLPGQGYTVEFHNSDHPDDGHHKNATINACIDVLPEYQSFTLNIYNPLEQEFERFGKDAILDVICHEIGHLHTNKLADLVENPFKTEEELRKTDEELTTKIGNYLYNICHLKQKKKRKKH